MWNDKIIEVENRLAVARDSGTHAGRKWVWLWKSHVKDVCGDGNALYLDCINLNIMIVMFYYSFSRCYLCGKPGKGDKGSILYYNCIWIYNYLKKKVNEDFRQGLQYRGASTIFNLINLIKLPPTNFYLIRTIFNLISKFIVRFTQLCYLSGTYRYERERKKKRMRSC